MDDAALLEAYDQQVRRRPETPAGFRLDRVEDPAPVLRLTPEDATAAWGGGVIWSALDETTADAAIEASVEWFRPLGREWEWKYFAYDRPADLPARLRAAGLVAAADEALLVGEVAVVRERLAGTPDPEDITIRRLGSDPDGAAADWAGINALSQAVWDEDATEQNAAIAADLAANPRGTSVWLAVAADGTVVCAARANFHDGTEFASLWGGSTLPAYRGRGIYRSLVARRADEAAERGLRFLQVDASPDSRPILERLGMRTLTTTTPYLWRPGHPRGNGDPPR